MYFLRKSWTFSLKFFYIFDKIRSKIFWKIGREMCIDPAENSSFVEWNLVTSEGSWGVLPQRGRGALRLRSTLRRTRRAVTFDARRKLPSKWPRVAAWLKKSNLSWVLWEFFHDDSTAVGITRANCVKRDHRQRFVLFKGFFLFPRISSRPIEILESDPFARRRTVGRVAGFHGLFNRRNPRSPHERTYPHFNVANTLANCSFDRKILDIVDWNFCVFFLRSDAKIRDISDKNCTDIFL